MPAAAPTAPGEQPTGQPQAGSPAPPRPSRSNALKRLKPAELGAGEWVDGEECAFGVDVSAKALAYVIWIRREQGAGRILTSAGDITGVEEHVRLYWDSAIPAGPYNESKYYELYDDSLQTEREGPRWAYLYRKDGGYYIASSVAPDLGPYWPRPDFAVGKGFFVARLPNGSYSLDGKPLAAQKAFTAGDTLAYTVRKADGEFLVVHGVTEKGPFQSIENVTVSEDGWAAIGRYADGTARLLSDSGDAYPVPNGTVDHLSRGGADSWAVVIKRGNAFILWSPEGGEQEPVAARYCNFYSDPGRVYTVAIYLAYDGDYYIRELETVFGPFRCWDVNNLTVTANGWLLPVVDSQGVAFAYRYNDEITVIPDFNYTFNTNPVMINDGKDMAFAIRGDEETAWVYWKGARMGPYRDVMQLAIHSGELLAAVHDQEGRSVLYRNGEPELTFPGNGSFLISQDGSSNLFRENREDSTVVYVNGKEVGEGLLLTCGETAVDGVPHWYWLSQEQEGSELFLNLYRFP